MKFTFDKALLPVLQSAMEASGKTVLSNVMLQLTGNDLLVSSTDTKLYYTNTITVKGEIDGECLVSIGKLCEVIGSLKNEEIVFSLSEDKAKASIKQGKARAFTIRTSDTNNFPNPPSVSSDNVYTLNVVTIKDIVQRVCGSVSDDETRYFMSGVFMEIKDNALLAVATDGRRLSLAKYATDTKDTQGIIVPSRILGMVAKKAHNTISVYNNEKYICFEFDGCVLQSVLIDGQFPNYKKVIPESQKYSCILNRKDTIEALTRVGLFTDSKSRRMFMALDNETMILTSEENELGSASEELDIKHNGTSTKIALNSLYFIDVLKASSEETITLEYTESNRALTFKDSTDGLSIIMPMQVS